MGAYLSTFASCIPTILYATLLAGQYTTPVIYCEVTAVFTNTAPVDAYRGAGRPEATYVVERLVETAAREMKIDPAEIRRRNFITHVPVPDAGRAAVRHRRLRRDARPRRMKLADVAGFAARKKASEAQAASCAAWATPATSRPAASRPRRSRARLGARAGLFEAGEVRVHPTGKVTVFTGSHSARPGARDHVRAGGRRSRFGIPIENVDIVHGDTVEDPVRHGHLRLALDRGRRHGDREGDGQDRRQGQEDRRAPAGGRRERHRVRGRRLPGRRHRQEEGVRRDRAHRLRAAQLSRTTSSSRA